MIEGTIDMDTDVYLPSEIPTDLDDDISTFETLRNGYGHITINCNTYPLNISGLRRAFAYAYDKSAVRQHMLEGHSQLHDSLVPATSGFCIEEELEWHYYDAQPETGNQILDDLGFDCDIDELVLSRAKRALEAGCDGVISSGLEAPKLREHVDPKLIVVTPGIRPVDNKPTGDQKRVVSVEMAFANGADHIVVGRPIRDAESPRAAAESIQATIAAQF